MLWLWWLDILVGFYFGTGGLVKAYTDSAKEAIKKAQVVEKILQRQYEVEVPYSYNDKIAYLCKNSDYKIVDTKYEENAKLYVAVKNEEAEKFEKDILDASNREASIKLVIEQFYAWGNHIYKWLVLWTAMLSATNYDLFCRSDMLKP